MLPQQYCLRWKYHHSNLQTMFSQLLDRGCFCDVTLACDGQLIRAHRVVLCACSTFFDTLLTNYASERDPIIIMKDVTFSDVKSLIEFMYKGEINVEHGSLASLLKTADDLKIKGLAEVSWRDDEDITTNGSSSGVALPPSDRDYRSHSLPRTHEGYAPTPASISGGVSASIASATSDIRESSANETVNERNVSSPPIQGSKYQTSSRLPMLTPKPPHSITNAPAAQSADQFYGPKRKRGRPPLDDAYDVFNVRNLAHYGGHIDSQPYLEVGRQQHGDNLQRHSSSAYQRHIQQQQCRQKQDHTASTDSDDPDDNQTDPEWITSNLEVNVAECDVAPPAVAQMESDSNTSATEQNNDHNKLEPNDKHSRAQKCSPAREHERISTNDTNVGTEKTSPKFEHRFKKRNMLDKAREQRQREVRDREKDKEMNKEKDKKGENDKEKENKYKEDEKKNVENEDDHRSQLILRSMDDIEIGQSKKLAPEVVSASISGNTIITSSISSGTTSSDMPGTSSQAKLTSNSGQPPHAHTHAHSHPHTHVPPVHSHAHSHYAKYAVAPSEAVTDNSAGGGYVLNEHGMLMTHDFPRHGSTAMGSAPNGDHDFVDLKIEDYDVADLRLTSEEMSEWQDVIKMDDYLAKGRRPQFWEEPFTRRVLDAIKNKRLEMKKAARILGVSYGTLYGRYREVYGCLKHPYSSTMRPTQSNQLTTVQPRFDIVWPSPKRDSGLQPSSLEIGKIRPKDLSELWARPQI